MAQRKVVEDLILPAICKICIKNLIHEVVKYEKSYEDTAELPPAWNCPSVI